MGHEPLEAIVHDVIISFSPPGDRTLHSHGCLPSYLFTVKELEGVGKGDSDRDRRSEACACPVCFRVEGAMCDKGGNKFLLAAPSEVLGTHRWRKHAHRDPHFSWGGRK